MNSEKSASLHERMQRRRDAAEAFDRHEHRNDGEGVASSLADGLNVLRDLLFTRVHDDVETAFGMDSMLMPVSESKSKSRAKMEIEIYQVAEAALDAKSNGYASADEDWFLNWLASLRLGDAANVSAVGQRLEVYWSKDPDDRRLAFSGVLERAFPEAQRAPLILYRLVPMAVSIATAIAFADHTRAAELRKRQTVLLPAITDCQRCHGGLLENGDQCQVCGNPLWKFDWLTAVE